MKKRNKLLALLLVTVLTFSAGACGSSDTDKKSSTTQENQDIKPAELLSASQGKLKDVSSMNAKMIMDMDMDISAEGESQSMQSVSTIDMSCFYDPLRFKIDMTMNAGELGTTSTTMYAETDDNGTCTMYMTDGTNWQSQEIDLNDLTQYNASSNMSEYMQESYQYESAGTEEVNGVKAYKLTGKVTGDNIKDAMLSSGALNSLSSLGIDSTQAESMMDGISDIPITLWIDADSQFPVKYEIEMTDAMNTLMSNIMKSVEGAEGASINITKMNMSMTCSDYNKAAEFSVPAEAKEA